MADKGANKAVPLMVNSATAGSTNEFLFDCLGIGHLSLDVILSTTDAPTNSPSVLKLSESDDTNATNFHIISGMVGGADFAIGNCSTTALNTYRFECNRFLKPRYVKLTVSTRLTQHILAHGRLVPGDHTPTTASQQNVNNLVEL